MFSCSPLKFIPEAPELSGEIELASVARISGGSPVFATKLTSILRSIKRHLAFVLFIVLGVGAAVSLGCAWS